MKKLKALNYQRVKKIVQADCERQVVSSISGAGVRVDFLEKQDEIWSAFVSYFEGPTVTDSYDWVYDQSEIRQIEKELIAQGRLK